MSEYRIYISLPLYLEQWLRSAFWNVESQRVEFPRKSAERIILELYLTSQPKGVSPSIKGLPVEVPTFYGKNPASHCHLPQRATQALISTIKKRFRKTLWDEMRQFPQEVVQITDLIYAFLEKHGIEPSEQNFLAVRQAYMRMRKVYENRQKSS